jgi:hypothetical protein
MEADADEIVEAFKKSRARSHRLPPEAYMRVDVMKAIANNRSIITLDLSDGKVRCIPHPPFSMSVFLILIIIRSICAKTRM